MGEFDAFNAAQHMANSDVDANTGSALSEWQILSVKTRVDSFNQKSLMDEIQATRARGHTKIALDLKANRFLSFPTIKFVVSSARELAESGGALALIGCPESTKRHFDIYGSLAHIQLVRFAADLQSVKKR